MTQPRYIFLAGLACVGKSTIGAQLADILGFRFVDLDLAAERFYDIPIRRLRDSYHTQLSFCRAIAQVLSHVLTFPNDLVVALPPDGLFIPLWHLIRETNSVVVLLTDTPSNISERVVFFDIDSKPINKTMTAEQKATYARKIKSDLAYLRHSFARAHVTVDISGISIDDAVKKVHLSVLGFM